MVSAFQILFIRNRSAFQLSQVETTAASWEMSDKYGVPESQTGFAVTGTSLHFTWIWLTAPASPVLRLDCMDFLLRNHAPVLKRSEFSVGLPLLFYGRLERIGGTRGIKSRAKNTEWPLLWLLHDEDQDGKATLTCKQQQLLLMWLVLLWVKKKQIPPQ